MHILFVSKEYPPNVVGGLGRYIERIAPYIGHAGHRLWVITPNYPGQFPSFVFTKTHTIIRPPVKTRFWHDLHQWAMHNQLCAAIVHALVYLSFNLQTFLFIMSIKRIRGIDVVAIHDYTNLPLALVLRLATRIPVVVHNHGTEMSMTAWGQARDRWRLIAMMERLLAWTAHAIIVPSHEMKKLLQQHGWDTRKVSVVAHGYEYAQHQKLDRHVSPDALDNVRQHLSLQTDQPVVVYVGRLNAVKGVFNLLDAMPAILAMCPDTRLILVGTGAEGTDDNAQVAAYIHKLGLAASVYAYYRSLPVEQVLTHYLLANVCVFPSTFEPFGLVALESMALARPVVLGRGFSRVLTGMDPAAPTALVAQGPHDVAQHVVYLLTHPAEAQQMGRRAQHYVTNTFTWAAAVEKTIAVYQTACHNRMNQIRIGKDTALPD
ncbi:MAG: glycosyltransferase family 4 protein [Chloroflexota bacterium]